MQPNCINTTLPEFFDFSKENLVLKTLQNNTTRNAKLEKKEKVKFCIKCAWKSLN